MNDELSDQNNDNDSKKKVERDFTLKGTGCNSGCLRWLVLGSIVAVVAAIAIPSLSGSRISAWENRCKITLRALGSSQLAFADGNNGDYGTWAEMAEDGFIQKGYTRDNIIDNYTIVTFEVTKSQKNDDGEIVEPPKFAIVATPNNVKNKIRTFAIGDEQIPYLWVGVEYSWTTENVDLHDTKLWEPLR